MTAAAELFFWVIAAWWASACLMLVLNLLLLPKLASDLSLREWPSLTVIIPARNEAAIIGRTIEAHCRQDYPRLQVVVVDDGSSDGTAGILDNLQRSCPCLEVVRGQEPPEGWLGKPNAQRVGLSRAKGDLLLFADADVLYAPGVHRRAVAELMSRNLDMLLLLSHLESRGLEPLVMTMLDAFCLYASPSFLHNIPWFRSFAFGAGSGNLVRRDAFEAAGGIDRIKAEVIDDVAMGKMMKRYRGRFRFVTAFDSIRVRMYEGLRGCVEGFTKNYYHFFGRNPLWAAFWQGGDLLVHTLPAALLLASLPFPALAPLRWPAGLAVAAGLICNAATCLWSRHPLWAALAFPLRPLLWSWILLRSAWRYYRRGLVWRGRTYGRLG
jgi:cellulose synthase/poly-beta-1,6-N-acetylglucosamine synthase-like glycosyltransferase